MSDGFANPRGEFRAPRVPFDLRCVILAAGGYLTLLGINWVLGQWWELDSPLAQTFHHILVPLNQVPFIGDAFQKATGAVWGWEDAKSFEWWKALITGLLFFSVWSLFGSAMLRTAAMRLTRDEPLTLKEALSFGALNWWTFLRAPVLVAAFALFFVLANMLAGLVMSFWFVGSSLLALILFPLVLISSLLVVVSIAGGLIGLPLIWAGISVEQNGALEAISRAFSYIFARPFRFFFGYFLIFVLMAVVIIVGNRFEQTVKETLKAGVVRAEFEEVISYERSEDEVYARSERWDREEAGIRDIRNLQRADWTDWIGFIWMWLLLWVFLLGFKGFALYIFLGGTASLYLQLRLDVDGTDEEEIYPESEEDLDAPAPEEEARWVGEGDAPKPDGGEGGEKPDPEPDSSSS